MTDDFVAARKVLSDFARTIMWISKRFRKKTPAEFIAERRLIIALDDLRIAVKLRNHQQLKGLIERTHFHFNEYWEEIMRRYKP